MSDEIRPGKGVQWAALAAGVLVLGAYLYHVSMYWQQINDDAYITFRYSRMLAEGNGPYFNPGEHVEGYTNFLMMLLMAGAIALLGPDEVPFIAKLVGVSGGLVAVVASWFLCWRWLRRFERIGRLGPVLAWTAGGLVATCAAFAVNSTTGLETTKFSALILVGLCLLQLEGEQRRWLGSSIAFALVALSRPEGALLFVVVFITRLMLREQRERGWLPILSDGAIVAVAVLGHLGLRIALYDGEWVPNTFYAKLGGFRGAGGELDYLWGFTRYHLGGVAVVLALTPILAGNATLRRNVAPSVAVLAAAVFSILTTGPDWMLGYRLLVPFTPVWAALAVCGVLLLVDRAKFSEAALGTIACIVLLGGVTLAQGLRRTQYLDAAKVRTRGYFLGHAALADWLGEVGQPGQSVALMDIGLVGYRRPEMRILDITGLTDRTIAKSDGGFLSKQFDSAYVYDQHPDFLVNVMTAPRGRESLDVRELGYWSEIGARLASDPMFGQHYLRPRAVSEDAEFLEMLAGFVGAARVFEHSHPGGLHYFLAVYPFDAEVPVVPDSDGDGSGRSAEGVDD